MKMRHDQVLRRSAPRVLSIAFLLCLVGISVTTYVSHEAPGSSAWPLSKVAGAADWLLPLFAVLVAILGPARSSFGAFSRWRTVHGLLSSLRGLMFREEIGAGAKDHHHRVTLFKRVRFRWTLTRPFAGWLIPVERSGNSTQRSNAVFLAPDHPDDATGIAGQAYFQEDILIQDGLKAPSEDVEGSKEEYAEKTWVEVNFYGERLPSARSYVGIRVTVKGKPWGVLVVDSISPDAKQGPGDIVAYAIAANAVGTILAGGR